MSILDTIKGAFGNVAGGAGVGGRAAVGIDIGSSAIKIVQLRYNKGQAILETYGEIALGPYIGNEVGKVTKLASQEIANALKDLMKEANVTEHRAGISIPFASSLTSIVEFPKVANNELKQMIPLEARKYIPVPIHEVMLDWLIIPEDPAEKEWSRVRGEQEDDGLRKLSSDKIEVLLVAIHNEILNNYQSISKNSGLVTSFYELEIFGTIRSSLGHGIAPMMIVDIGASSTKVYIVERGIIRLSHLVNLGGQEMTLALTRAFGWNFKKAERIKREQGIVIDKKADRPEQALQVRDTLLSTLGRIFTEVNRVLLSYEKKYGKDISKVVLSGGGAGLIGLGEYVKKQVPVEVELSDPFEKVKTPAFLKDVLKEVGPEFAVAVGVALRKLKT